MGRQASFRWKDGEDDQISAILADFALSGMQADVIRLALYRLLMPEYELPASLRGVAGQFPTVDADPVAPQPAIQVTATTDPALIELLTRAIERPVHVTIEGAAAATNPKAGVMLQ